jgi:diacylglycerol kinase (ATP)
MSQRALLLVNRHSRRGRESATAAIAHLQALGLTLVEAATEDPADLSQVICDHRDRVDLVIVGGGDGTLNAAARGLVETGLPLGILPLGTANDLARTLGLPMALPNACAAIAQGLQHNQQLPIDLGWVNGHYFFNVASLGLSVKITQQLSQGMKRRWGVVAYAITALRVLSQSVPFTAEIRMNGEYCRVKTAQIAVGNGRYYGGGMTVQADAAITDQRLDLYSLEIRHWWQMIPLLPSMRRGTHGSWDFVRSLQGQEIEIHTRKPHPINTDGEITTTTPAHFRVIPNAISVVGPAIF